MWFVGRSFLGIFPPFFPLGFTLWILHFLIVWCTDVWFFLFLGWAWDLCSWYILFLLLFPLVSHVIQFLKASSFCLNCIMYKFILPSWIGSKIKGKGPTYLNQVLKTRLPQTTTMYSLSESQTQNVTCSRHRPIPAKLESRTSSRSVYET